MSPLRGGSQAPDLRRAVASLTWWDNHQFLRRVDFSGASAGPRCVWPCESNSRLGVRPSLPSGTVVTGAASVVSCGVRPDGLWAPFIVYYIEYLESLISLWGSLVDCWFIFKERLPLTQIKRTTTFYIDHASNSWKMLNFAKDLQLSSSLRALNFLK